MATDDIRTTLKGNKATIPPAATSRALPALSALHSRRDELPLAHPDRRPSRLRLRRGLRPGRPLFNFHGRISRRPPRRPTADPAPPLTRRAGPPPPPITSPPSLTPPP